MKVTLIAAVSADGKIAPAEGQSSLAWTSKEDTRFFVEKTKEIGTLVMGRKTFETIGKPLSGRRIFVMTRMPQGHSNVEVGDAAVEFTDLMPGALIQRLVDEKKTGLAVCGGSEIYTRFLSEFYSYPDSFREIEFELFLSVEPHLFAGNFTSLLQEGAVDDVRLSLREVSRLGTQTVLLHYDILPPEFPVEYV